MRVLINHADTTLGVALTLELRKFEAGRNLLYGTELGGEGRKVRKSIRSVLAKDPPKLLLRTLPQCQVVVFALQNTPLEELDRALAAIEAHDFDKQFCFILISGVETWGQSEIPEAPEGEEKGTILNETMFESRKPLPGYEGWKALEDRVLALREKPLVQSFVVCAGVLYGGADGPFHDHFKAAWLGTPVEQAPVLQIGGPKGGQNVVPLCHCRDVAKLVKLIASSEDMAGVTPYQIAVDGKPATQQQIVEGIVRHVSDVPQVPVNPDFEPQPELTLDLEIEASPSMKADDFEWSFPDGMLSQIARTAKEFTLLNNLRAVRVCVLGAPLAGKTLPARMVAEHFRLPLLDPKTVLAEAKTAPGEFGQQFREMLNGLESDLAVQGDPRPDDGPRVPDEWLVKAFRWKLATNACKFRGYVLDGFPRTRDEARALFMVDKPLEEGEEAPGEGEEAPQVVSAEAPEYCVELSAEPKTLRTRVEMLPDDERVAGHNDLAGLERRTALHLERTAAGGECTAFFQEAGVEVLTLDDRECALGKEDLFETCRLYVEQKGRPNNYLDSLEVVDERRRGHFEELEERALQQLAIAEMARKGSKETDLAVEREQELQRLMTVREHEQQLAELREKPLRPFLMDCAIPKLTEGLVELCRVSPENPLDFLADFLEREALK